MESPNPESDAPAAFRALCDFGLSLRFEIFYALDAVTSPDPKVQRAWCEVTKDSLPKAFWDAYDALGNSPVVWALGPDLFAPEAQPASFEALVDAIASAPATVLRDRFLFGLLHEAPVVEELLTSGDIPRALAMCSMKKREWYTAVGLFPYRQNAPIIEAIRRMATDPEAYLEALLSALRVFWNYAFEDTWQRLEAGLRRSADDKARLFSALDFSEFASASLLRVELDERKGTLRAIRGGYEVPLARIGRCHFVPSLFNERRQWSAYKADDDQAIVHFPYWDPALVLDGPLPLEVLAPSTEGLADLLTAATTAPHTRPATVPEGADTPPEPSPATIPHETIAMDPAAVFRALGHAMRFSIATLLAENPRTSAELAQTLEISKANMSHHLKELREAGLIDEKKLGGRRIELSLRREVLAQLSAVTLARLFPGAAGDLPASLSSQGRDSRPG